MHTCRVGLPFRSVRFALALLLAILALEGTSADNPDSLVLIEGDVTVAALLRTNQLQDGKCGKFNVYSLQELMALTWFLDSVNAMNYVNNVTIGLEVVRTCKIPQKANHETIELLTKHGVGFDNTDNTSILLGLIGPDRTSEAASVSKLIASLPTNQHLPQISGSATGRQLNDRTLHPNFFRVIPSDAIQIQVILELLLQLQWNYIAIVFADDDYGKAAAEELRHLAQGKQICVPVYESLPLDVGSESFIAQLGNIVSQVTSIDKGIVRGMVVIGGRTITHLLVSRLQEQAKFVQLVLSEAAGLQSDTLLNADSQLVLSGALLTAPPDLYFPEYTPFWNELWTNRTHFSMYADRNDWLKDHFVQTVGCLPDFGNCWDSQVSIRNRQTISEGVSGRRELSLYVGYQVKAIAVMVTLLKQLHDDKCGSTFKGGVCPELRKAISGRQEVLNTLQRMIFNFEGLAPVSKTMANVSAITFDAQGDSTETGSNEEYSLYNLKKSGKSGDNDFNFQKVGEFSSGQLSINKSETRFYSEKGDPMTWSELPHAHCALGYDCLQCERDLSNDIIFVEGDLYVIAIVPVHSKNADDLLKCGEIKELVGADIAQAIIYAVNNVNEKSGEFNDVLPGRKVGLVGITSCGSSLLVKQHLMDVLSGRLQLPNGSNSSVLMGRVMGVVGAFFSSNSIAASEILTTLNRTFVQVSAASTSTTLKDRTRHPFFMRLVPPDDKQAQVILDIVKRLGANYVQVIYDSSTAYASGLFAKLQEETSSGRHKVCIAQSIATTPHEEISQYKYIVDDLRDESAARLVIVILHAFEIEKVMAAILPLLTSNDDFLFLASESWGRRQTLIEGRTRLKGSLVLSQEIAVDKVFEKYFQKLDPFTSVNPWLKYFWEARQNCYFDNSFQRKDKSQRCPAHFASNYVQDSRVPFHIQAVYALVKGFDAALTKYCGPRASSVCEALTSPKLISEMSKVELDLYATGQYSPVFDDNGDGMVGYNVLKVSVDFTTSENSVIYENVGLWTTEGLTLDQSGMVKLSSICPNPLKCDRCFPARNIAKGVNSSCDDSKGFPIQGAMGLGVGLGLFIIILVVIVICQTRRVQKLSETKGRHTESQAVKEESPYSSPEEIPACSSGKNASSPSAHRGIYLTPCR